MSTLLSLKRTDVGYYCNCGPAGHKMKMDDDPVLKQQWTCDLVLCMPCYENRKKSMMGEEGGKRSRRKKC